MLILILCEMIEVETMTLLDGDTVYYKLSSNREEERLQGPFTVVGDADPSKYMLKNMHGTKFFLRSINHSKFYKKA
jgi:hypothetical protein